MTLKAKIISIVALSAIIAPLLVLAPHRPATTFYTAVSAPLSAATPAIEKAVVSSVTVLTPSGSGSGTVLVRGGIAFVITAAHVVGEEPAVLVSHAVLDSDRGAEVCQGTVSAHVVAVSTEYDLALLRIDLPGVLFGPRVEIYDGPALPIGTPIFHVGSWMGPPGAQSFSTGVVSAHGRTLVDEVFDQATTTGFPGSSGGGIWTTDGKLAGILVRGSSPTWVLYVPTRRIWQWAQEEGLPL